MPKTFAKRTSVVLASAIILPFLLSGCTGAPEPPRDGEVNPAAAEPAADSGATTIEEVFEKLNCKEHDPLGTRGSIDDTPNKGKVDQLVRNGTCVLLPDGSMTFFFEFGSSEDARAVGEAGEIEASPGELFQDGSVLIWARNSKEQALVGLVAEEVDVPDLEVPAVSIETTCNDLLGTGEDVNPLMDAAEIMSVAADEESLSSVSVTTLAETVDSLKRTRKFADAESRPFIEILLQQLEGFLDVKLGNKEDFMLSTSEFKVALSELTTQCTKALL